VGCSSIAIKWNLLICLFVKNRRSSAFGEVRCKNSYRMSFFPDSAHPENLLNEYKTWSFYLLISLKTDLIRIYSFRSPVSRCRLTANEHITSVDYVVSKFHLPDLSVFFFASSRLNTSKFRLMHIISNFYFEFAYTEGDSDVILFPI